MLHDACHAVFVTSDSATVIARRVGDVLIDVIDAAPKAQVSIAGAAGVSGCKCA